MHLRLKFLLFIAFLFSSFVIFAQLPDYKNPSFPVEKRVKDLLNRMTPEEKFWQLFMIPGDLDASDSNRYYHGIFGFQVSAAAKGDAGGQLLNYAMKDNAAALARKINSIQHYFIEKSRLGIPIIAFDEALHGLVRGNATAFPQSIALAATWDTALVNKAANAIADETKLRGIRQILSPVVNIASDVRWGRTEETYGEDPFLTSEIAVAFVSAFEKKGIITTPKHFIANVGDGGRDSYPIHFNERLLEEIYLPPFKACFERGGSRSVMTAYNSLDGTASSSNKWLLLKKLKGDYGFSGFVISDANAVGGELVLHNTAKDYPESGMHAINGGLDVIFQTDYNHYKLFNPHFLDGSIDSNRLDDAVARVLKAKFELGLFENPYVPEVNDKKIADQAKHKEIAVQVARESIVLLKNKKETLPLGKNIRSIAVIGTDAVEARLGGYSGPGNGKICILDGIKARAGKNIKINYSPGCGRSSDEYTVVDSKYLSSGNQKGLQGEYFNNITLNGKAVLTRTDNKIDFHWTLFSPSPDNLPADFYSIRWTGKLTSPVTGNYKIGLEGNDGYRLYIGSKLVIDNWQKQSYRTQLSDLHLEKDKQYDICIEFFEPSGNATIKLVWNAITNNDWQKKIQDAVIAAKQSDVAIVTVGIQEGEFQDRAMLSLPGKQEQLIQQVAATGKPVVVVLVAGSAVIMNNWLAKVNSVIDVWYPGEEGGHAITDVLFGDYNPAGRLPVTFPVHEAQLPLVYNHKPTGRGDDYNNLSGFPLFPFGYGLSYTGFDYSNMQLSKRSVAKSDSVTVSFTIKNIGKRNGEEVIQLYIHDMLASVSRPVIELKGFQRVYLNAGETKEVSFTITPEMLSMLNANMEKVIEPGEFRIMIGASSRDLRLKDILTVRD
ncbi:MAG: glycoside hydrolase family 3 C-terminal domain-containing protein [Chitinophagaceae bacterium]